MARLIRGLLALGFLVIAATSLRGQSSIIQSLSPSRANAGGPSFTLSVIAVVSESGFSPGSIVYWNGTPRPTTTGPCQLLRIAILDCIQATIPASDIANPGTSSVSVLNAGGFTNALTFSIDAPGQSVAVPTLSKAVVAAFGSLLALAGLLAVSRGFKG